MAGDKHQTEDVSFQITYTREYKEDIHDPGPSLSYPTQSPEDFLKITKYKIRNVFCFLMVIAFCCMGAVALDPKHIVEIAATVIFGGSLGFGRYLLGHT